MINKPIQLLTINIDFIGWARINITFGIMQFSVDDLIRGLFLLALAVD